MIISKEAIDWLEENNLLELAKQNAVHFEKIFKDCLKARKEEILIIGDKGIEENKIAAVLAGSYFLAAQNLNLKPHLILQNAKYKGDKADKRIVEGLKDLRQNNITIMALSKKLGSVKPLSKGFRTFAKENFHKFASATNLGGLSMNKLKYVIDSINVDYDQMRERAENIKQALDQGETIRVTTAEGTDITVGIKNQKAIINAGDYSIGGSGGNLPAGEVYIPPRFKDIEGKVVVDGSYATRYGTRLIRDPITITIEKGEVVKIEGGEEAEQLKETLEWAKKKAKHPWGVTRVGELGIGINPNAKVIGATIVDEKTLGTAHIGIGSNHWFGGTIYAIIHLDQVFRNPKIYIDNKLLTV
jgi:leucyl aminopeptidase (aminopeptidase T)